MEYLKQLLASHSATLVSFEQIKEMLDDVETPVTRGKVILADGTQKYFTMIVDFKSLTPEDQRVWLEDAVSTLFN